MAAKQVTRRNFLRFAGLGAAALLIRPERTANTLPAPRAQASTARPGGPAQAVREVPQPRVPADALEVNMRAAPSEVSILPGSPTKVWTYQASVVKGDPASVIPVPGSYLGPIIRIRQGQHLKINFTNGLPGDTTVHVHGPSLPSPMGGHPMMPVHPGDTYAYEFDMLDQAAPFWFHPHPHQTTAYQVYQGLAGLLLVSDEAEAQMGLASGEYDIPVVIQDRIFDANNQWLYFTGGMPMMMAMQGFLGNRILVNGQPDYVLTVAPGTYRLRLYNGSQARLYKLAWQDGSPLTVIGTDGGFLPKPVQRKYVMLGCGERVDLWADLSKAPEGTEMVLQSLPFQSSTMGMMGMMGGMMGGGTMGGGTMGGGMMGGGTMGGGMMGGGMMGGGMMGGAMMAGQTALPQGAAFPVVKVRVQGAAKPALTLPATFSSAPHYQLQDAVNINAPRTIYLGMQHMTWTLNGRVFDLQAIADDEHVPFNKVEVWDFVNHTMIPHPMHIHNVQFNVVGRQPSNGGAGAYQTVSEGLVDGGWKDTVLVMPGERVRLLVKFANYPGMFMYHCHILEHESMGMMRNLMVE